MAAWIRVKGIISRDFGGLQMISMDRTIIPDVPLEVSSFLNFRFHIVFEFLSLQRVKLLMRYLAKA